MRRDDRHDAALELQAMYEHLDSQINVDTLRSLLQRGTAGDIDGFQSYVHSLHLNDMATQDAVLERLVAAANELSLHDLMDLYRVFAGQHRVRRSSHPFDLPAGTALIQRVSRELRTLLMERQEALRGRRRDAVHALRAQLWPHARWCVGLLVTWVALVLGGTIGAQHLVAHVLPTWSSLSALVDLSFWQMIASLMPWVPVLLLLGGWLVLGFHGFDAWYRNRASDHPMMASLSHLLLRMPSHPLFERRTLASSDAMYHLQSNRFRRCTSLLSRFEEGHVPVAREEAAAEGEEVQALHYVSRALCLAYRDMSRGQGQQTLRWSAVAAAKEALAAFSRSPEDGDNLDHRYLDAQRLWMLLQVVVPEAQLQAWFKTTLVYGEGMDPTHCLSYLLRRSIDFSVASTTRILHGRDRDVAIVASMYAVFCSLPVNRERPPHDVLRDFLRAWSWRSAERGALRDRLKHDVNVLLSLFAHLWSADDRQLIVLRNAFEAHLMPKLHRMSWRDVVATFQASFRRFMPLRLGLDREVQERVLADFWFMLRYVPQLSRTLSGVSMDLGHVEGMPAGLLACAQDPATTWVLQRVRTASMHLRLRGATDSEATSVNALMLAKCPSIDADAATTVQPNAMPLEQYVDALCRTDVLRRSSGVPRCMESWLFLRAATLVAQRLPLSHPRSEGGEGGPNVMEQVAGLFQGAIERMLRRLERFQASSVRDTTGIRHQLVEFLDSYVVVDAVDDSELFTDVHKRWWREDLQRFGLPEVWDASRFSWSDRDRSRHPVAMSLPVLGQLVARGPVHVEPNVVEAFRNAPYLDVCLALGWAFDGAEVSTTPAAVVSESGSHAPEGMSDALVPYDASGVGTGVGGAGDRKPDDLCGPGVSESTRGALGAAACGVEVGARRLASSSPGASEDVRCDGKVTPARAAWGVVSPMGGTVPRSAEAVGAAAGREGLPAFATGALQARYGECVRLLAPDARP